jgi:hypothetical protein
VRDAAASAVRGDGLCDAALDFGAPSYLPLAVSMLNSSAHSIRLAWLGSERTLT